MSENGKISKIIDHTSAVINLGREDGVYEGQKYLIYQLGDMIQDPDTDEEIEQLEIVKGNARAIQVQQKVSIIEGFKTERYEIESKTGIGILYPSLRIKFVKTNIIDENNPDNPQNVMVGDFVRALE